MYRFFIDPFINYSFIKPDTFFASERLRKKRGTGKDASQIIFESLFISYLQNLRIIIRARLYGPPPSLKLWRDP